MASSHEDVDLKYKSVTTFQRTHLNSPAPSAMSYRDFITAGI